MNSKNTVPVDFPFSSAGNVGGGFGEMHTNGDTYLIYSLKMLRIQKKAIFY